MFIPSVSDAVNSRIRHLITVEIDVIFGYLRMIIRTLDNEGKMAASTHGNARLKRQRSLVSFTSGGGLLQTKVLKRGERPLRPCLKGSRSVIRNCGKMSFKHDKPLLLKELLLEARCV